MAKYVISVFGYEINASCHELTQEQAKILISKQQENNNGHLSDLGYDVELLLNDFFLFQKNAWDVNKPLINDRLNFSLSMGNGSALHDFSIHEIINQVEIDPNTKQAKFLVQPNKLNKSILLYYETNKGEICEFTFESDFIPDLKDISYSTGEIQTPDNYILFLDRLYFRGEEISCVYDNNSVDGKAAYMKVWIPG